MNDIGNMQKEMEDKLFNFIEENFGKKRYECFNEVMNFVEDELIYDSMNYNEIVEELEMDNEELESNTENLYDAFNSLKEDSEDVLEEIESELENIISNNELDSITDKLNKLKELVSRRHKQIEKTDVE